MLNIWTTAQWMPWAWPRPCVPIRASTSTSCPNVSDWLAAYEGADEVYAITITGTLSGSYNAAQLAAEEYQQENPGRGCLCWTAFPPARSSACWPSICGTAG